MGKEKQSSTTVVNQQTTPTPTAEETSMNQLLLGQMQASDPLVRQAQASGLGLVNTLLQGQIPGGFYQGMTGISPEAIGAQATELTQQNLPGFQNTGLLDSGVMQREIARTIANQLLFPAEQYNIGAKQNLLNLALSGQAQVQQPVIAGQNTLASNLQGLRSTNVQGTTNQTQYSMNPFLKSFQQGLGTSLGTGSFGSAWKPW